MVKNRNRMESRFIRNVGKNLKHPEENQHSYLSLILFIIMNSHPSFHGRYMTCSRRCISNIKILIALNDGK